MMMAATTSATRTKVRDVVAMVSVVPVTVGVVTNTGIRIHGLLGPRCDIVEVVTPWAE